MRLYFESATLNIPLWKCVSNTCLEILEILESDIETADLLKLSKSTPNYGLMNCLESLLELCSECPEESKKVLLNKFFQVCSIASEFAAPVVNASSPEGFLPDSENEILIKNMNLDGRKANSDTDAAQLLLVMCWRMTKSVSMLMGSISSVLKADIQTYKH